MKFKKLLAKAERLFSAAKREEEVKKKSLKKLITKLQKYEVEKEAKLKSEDDEEVRERLQKKILVARAQRKKGKALLREMEGDSVTEE